MPFAPIDKNGITFYYTDSGAPPGVLDYTTIVLIHGFLINSGIFERMLPYASKYGLRLITVNMRDYAGSTPYTDDELAQFASSDADVQLSAVRNFGREFGAFMVFVCTWLGIPAMTVHDGKTHGGLALVTWSLSTIGILSIFGDPMTLTKKQKSVLRPYLRTVFAYDPPLHLYGGKLPLDGFSFPVTDPAVPDPDKPMGFVSWVSGYHTAVPDLAHLTLDALHARTEHCPPTLHAMSSDDVERITEPYTLARSGRAMVQIPPSVYKRYLRTTFLDAEAVLPEVRIVHLWCDQAVYGTLWSAKMLDELLREEPEPGERRREAKLVKIENANHMYHWDEPERCVQTLRDNL